MNDMLFFVIDSILNMTGLFLNMTLLLIVMTFLLLKMTGSLFRMTFWEIAVGVNLSIPLKRGFPFNGLHYLASLSPFQKARRSSCMKSVRLLSAFSFLLLGASGCATIIGGTDYAAHVVTPNHSNAAISYNGTHLGTGTGIASIERKNADKVVFTVREEGCPEQTFRYATREVRGGTIAGNLLGIGGLIGIAIDFATGAVWKPNVNEPGVSKMDYMHFRYTLPYNGCGAADAPKVADGLDTYYFTGGRVVRGTMLEQTADGKLKVQLENGSTETYKMSNLERMVRGTKK